MPENNGYVVIFNEPKRAERLIELIEKTNEFSDVLSAPDWRMKSYQVCILSFDEKNFTHVAMAKKGSNAASYKCHVKFKMVHAFNPISIESVENLIDKSVKVHFKKIISVRGGRLPPRTWKSFKKAIGAIQPNVLSKINSLEDIINHSREICDSRSYEILAQEKDVLGLALSIFGIDRSKFLSNYTLHTNNEVPPFLQGIKAYKLSEDNIISHDNRVFPDWVVSNESPILASVEFRKNDERLIVLNTNRTSIEHTLGVDLIYYHYKYRSFVLVQYKIMKPEGESNYKYVYRPFSDKSYMSEIKRMGEFESRYNTSSKKTTVRGFRLHEAPFFFKVCKPLTLDPMSSELAAGMYFPLSYWKVLLESESVKGPRGGKAISYDNAGRWINNTSFIDLVQNGWIGSAPHVSENISEIIKNLLAEKHSITIALHEAI